MARPQLSHGTTLTPPALVRLLGRWSGSGPAYRDLAAALRLLVLDGRVPLGAALPGERELAAALGVSRTTVAASYGALREQGHLVSRPGARSTTALPSRPGRPHSPGLPAPDGVLDLAYATLPAPQGVHQAYAAALEALPAHLPGHGYEPQGLPALRAAVAERYAARGLPTTPDQVLVTSGAQQALGMLLAVLTSPGDRVLVDAPTYPHALDALRHAGCRAVPVALPVGEPGWDVDGVRAALRQTAPRLAYVVADFHNPTGRVMPDEQRTAIVRAARETRTTLVVDEALVDLGLDAPPPAPVAARGGEVVTLGSMSKSFWGGLRIGWVRGPAGLVARLAGLRTSVDMGSPVVEQLAAVALLADAERLLEPRREALRGNRAGLLRLLAEHLPSWEVVPPAGGLSLWARLPGAHSTALAAAALGQGVRLTAGPRFGLDGAFEREVRVPYTLPPDRLELAVLGLARAERSLTGDAPLAAVV